MTEIVNKFTPQQEVFLDKFLEECFSGTDYTLAAAVAKEAAGYADTYSVDKVLEALKEELVRRCQGRLSLSIPKAIKEVTGVLNDPTRDGSRRTLEAATIIMDRAGLIKQERIDMEVKAESGVILIPPKLLDKK